jgi:Mn2+/Fe2+ NRAMP family transporter
VKEAGKLLDRFVQLIGLLMICLILYVAFTSSPPLGVALTKTVFPDNIDVMTIVTLVGGTVGGYITFAGGHRLLDAGITGKEALPQVTGSAISGIGVASLIRIFLFLAALGVVSKGLVLDESNPPASVFALAAGQAGYKLFGLVMVSAAITSVIGSAYTSVSFLKSYNKKIQAHENLVIITFIALSTLVFVWIGRPVKLLIFAGALNGLILPITLGSILIAAYHTKITGDYQHPLWLSVFGVLVVIVMAWMGIYTLLQMLF